MLSLRPEDSEPHQLQALTGVKHQLHTQFVEEAGQLGGLAAADRLGCAEQWEGHDRSVGLAWLQVPFLGLERGSQAHVVFEIE